MGQLIQINFSEATQRDRDRVRAQGQRVRRTMLNLSDDQVKVVLKQMRDTFAEIQETLTGARGFQAEFLQAAKLRMLSAIDAFETRWVTSLQNRQRESFETGARSVLDSLAKAADPVRLPLVGVDPATLIISTRRSLDRIKGITDGMREAIRTQINLGISAARTTQQVMAGIRGVLEPKAVIVEKAGIMVKERIGATARAVMITRTEMGQTFALGAQARVEQLVERQSDLADAGIVATKRWLSTIDALTRRAHVIANGQRVGIDEKFTVGGEEMEHPLDPKASGKNIINCRCVHVVEAVFLENAA